jgi:hypothetical protein
MARHQPFPTSILGHLTRLSISLRIAWVAQRTHPGASPQRAGSAAQLAGATAGKLGLFDEIGHRVGRLAAQVKAQATELLFDLEGAIALSFIDWPLKQQPCERTAPRVTPKAAAISACFQPACRSSQARRRRPSRQSSRAFEGFTAPVYQGVAPYTKVSNCRSTPGLLGEALGCIDSMANGR